MNIRRIKNILLFQINKSSFGDKEIIRIPLLSLSLFLIGLFVFLPFSFYTTNNQVFFLGLEMRDYSASDINSFIETWLIVGWWLVAVFELPIVLLVPLVDSFSVSQTIWIRLTFCSPVELSWVRFFWVLAYATWLLIMGSLFISIITFSHQEISPFNDLIDILGLASFTTLCGGIAVIAMSIIRSISSYEETISRFLVVSISFSIPILLYLLFSLIASPYIGISLRYFPYSIGVPSIILLDPLAHFLASLGLGVILLMIHVFLSRSIPTLSTDKKMYD